ncbi:MAG: hypothetical protein ACREAC_25400, partial [Blastocatellia bacterium]
MRLAYQLGEDWINEGHGWVTTAQLEEIMDLEQRDAATFEPENELEIALAEAREGHIAIDACVEKLLSNDLFILSKSEVLQDGSGIAPLLFDFEGTT